MIPDLLRSLTPQVVTALVRRYGDFDACEDAVQEALLAASQQWPSAMPDNPKGWLITTASRRRIEQLRSETARQRREAAVALAEPPDPAPVAVDDTLTLLLLCCHPSLSRPSQVALTLRAVGGLTTAEIARAFLVPEATIGQRISRAKRSLRGERFVASGSPDRVLEVLYLIFTEGHTASSGDAVNRVELTTEAIRLTRQLRASLPEDGEVTGLLALMLLTDARRPARVSPSGELVPLASQDRSLWNREFIAEGTALITGALSSSPVGPYQLQAAIAAVHDEAASTETTDWAQILTLYDLLRVVAPGPMVTVNRVVALAQVAGPEAGLAELAAAASDPALAAHHRVDAVRAHLLELSGDVAGARQAYLAAAERTLSVPEQGYLRSRAAALAEA
ncbi:sigma-70 family RNA polymerase sigma factor [Amycolatopsis sp. FBCC-B4732]|uniref:RNA polymerase sigma factor n=1 Tax=Amycolatopsis sp. FBCC-B4732 TaxID=3079339 RepID=UPI001FF5D53B|nr:sigma-70 family RNA polymerase sigma factor [Amycolatopsis sp. FBCC-B4732]UOX87694.1 sigma-70 family RNA polymerase sigma factor [Amycolatopsis sp. FBCC-B4732]